MAKGSTWKKIILYLVSGFMELSWIQGIIILSNTFIPYPFSFLLGYISYLLGFLIRGISFPLQWMNLLSRVLPYLFLNHLYLNQLSGSLFQEAWWLALTERPLSEILPLFLWSVFLLAFYFGGYAQYGRGIHYSTISARFDLGILILFLLFFVDTYGEIHILRIFPHLFIYFTASILALSLSREDDFLGAKSHRLGVTPLLIPILIFLLVVGSLVFLFPLIREGTIDTYGRVKNYAAPLAPFFLSLLRFLFMGYRGETDAGPLDSGEPQWLERREMVEGANPISLFLHYIFISFLILIFLLLLGWFLYTLYEWLTSPVQEKRTPLGKILKEYLAKIRLYLQKRRAWKKSPYIAGKLFAYLLLWGKHSGSPYQTGETPFEYSLRLQKRFPNLKRELETLVWSYYQEVHGTTPLVFEEKSLLQRTKTSLKNPALWPRRFFYFWWR